LLGRAAFTVPVNYKLDLSTSPLGAEGVGLVKPVDPAYATLVIPNNKTTFSQASDKVVALAAEFMFPETKADWLPVWDYRMADDSGNVWFYGQVANAPLHVQIESTAVVDAGTNEFTLDICGGSTPDMAITTARANAVLDHLLGKAQLAPPADYYLGMSLTPLSAEGIGATEPTAGEYARVRLPNDKNTFASAANNKVGLAKEFKFAKALVEWGTCTHFFISDSPTGGNVWWCGKLTYPRTVEVATTLVINTEGLSWALGNCA
jgi:hypothetical protein